MKAISMQRPRLDFRILDILSTFHYPISIRKLSSIIKKNYGTGSYANINKKLHEMGSEKLVTFTKIGRTMVASLNFENYNTINLLVEMESYKAKELLSEFTLLSEIINQIHEHQLKYHFLHSLTIINAENNYHLNRIEFLTIFKPKEIDKTWRKEFDEKLEQEKHDLGKFMLSLSRNKLIRIDYLLLFKKDFIQLIQSDEINQVKEMLLRKVVLINASAFWTDIKQVYENRYLNIDLQSENFTETNPAEITENDMVYNLARFGYKEFGSTISKGKNFSIEYVITAILMKGDIRRKEAIPILIVKNKEAITMELLGFLSRKYKVLDKLLEMFDTTNWNYINDLREKFGTYGVL